MKQLNINFGKSRIRVQLLKRHGGDSVSISSFISELGTLRSGNKFSRVFRHVFEKFNIRGIVGRNLVAFVVATSVITPNVAALSTNGGSIEANAMAVPQETFSTDVVVQYPVELVHINQGFRLYHPGVDFEGVTGDAVRPIMAGHVSKIEKSRFAYGNSIIVDHENGFSSRYAHLSSMLVREDDFVDTRTVIGAVGSTGRSTGDHLHLEVYKEDKTVNPLSVLPR